MTKEGINGQVEVLRKKLKNTSNPFRKQLLQAAIAALLKLLPEFFAPAAVAAKKKTPTIARIKAK